MRRGVAGAWRLLGPAVAEREYRRGRAFAAADARAEGLRRPPGRHAATAADPLAGVLTAREAEVLHLAVEGPTDAEIAGALHLSRRTVGNHLSSVYRKLGVGSRTAAIREARHGGTRR